MPKLKTKSGAKKRFSRTASGKIKAKRTTYLQKGDAGLVLTYMPYLRG